MAAAATNQRAVTCCSIVRTLGRPASLMVRLYRGWAARVQCCWPYGPVSHPSSRTSMGCCMLPIVPGSCRGAHTPLASALVQRRRPCSCACAAESQSTSVPLGPAGQPYKGATVGRPVASVHALGPRFLLHLVCDSLHVRCGPLAGPHCPSRAVGGPQQHAARASGGSGAAVPQSLLKRSAGSPLRALRYAITCGAFESLYNAFKREYYHMHEADPGAQHSSRG